MSVRTLRPQALCAPLILRPAYAIAVPSFRNAANALPQRSYSSSPEQLTATRTLQLPAIKIFDIITDIASYPQFIPFCTSATVDSVSKPDEHYQREWPQRATLRVGYGSQLNESFTSTVYCQVPVPEKGRAGLGIVEALSGSAQHSLDPETIKHHTSHAKSGEGADPTAGPLEYMKCKWGIREFPYKPANNDGGNPQLQSVEKNDQEHKNTTPAKMSDVSLSLEYKFKNPVYEMMGKAVTKGMADRMIDAFIKRVESIEGSKVSVSTGDSVGLGDHAGKQ